LYDRRELKKTHSFIQKNEGASFTLPLKQLHKEIEQLGYTGMLFLLDELGKIIEYGTPEQIQKSE